MQEEVGSNVFEGTGAAERSAAELIRILTNNHFQLTKHLIKCILHAFQKAKEVYTDVAETVEEEPGQTKPPFTAEQLAILDELSEALENQDAFTVALAKLKSLLDLTSPSRSSIAICLLLARLYQCGHDKLLNADPIQALSYFKTVCELGRRSEDSFVVSCSQFALGQVEAAALKENRPGAILYLVHYYFCVARYDIMDQWEKRMPEAYKSKIEEWYHKNDVHFKRVMMEENATNITEIVQELCRSLLEHVDESNRQELVISELVKRAERIQQDSLCAVPLLRTLIVMIKDRRFKDEFIDRLLEKFELRRFFNPSPDAEYGIKLAQVYLVIVSSNEESFGKLKQKLEAKEEVWTDAVEALSKLLSQKLIPSFLSKYPNFESKLNEVSLLINRPNNGFK